MGSLRLQSLTGSCRRRRTAGPSAAFGLTRNDVPFLFFCFFCSLLFSCLCRSRFRIWNFTQVVWDIHYRKVSNQSLKVLSFRYGFSREEPAVLWGGDGAGVLPMHHGEQGPRDPCWDDGASHGAGVAHKAGTSGAFTRKFSYTASHIWRVMRVARHSLQVSNSLRLGLANSLGFSHPKDHNNTSDESVELGCVLN